MPAPFQRPAEQDEMVPTPTPPLAETEPQEHAQSVEAALERARPLWEAEWKLLDVERCGRVSRAELTRFLASCELKLPPADLQRFLEGYGDPTCVDCRPDRVWHVGGNLTDACAGPRRYGRSKTSSRAPASSSSAATTQRRSWRAQQ